MWVWIVATLLVLAAVTIGVFLLRHNWTRRSPAAVELRAAEQALQAAVSRAENAEATAQKRYDARVKQAELHVGQANLVGRELLATYRSLDGTLQVYADRLEMGGKSLALTGDVIARVESAGNLYTKARPTVTRMVAGTVLGGKAGAAIGGAAQKSFVQDGRELYLSLESKDTTTVLACDPRDGRTVRQLAATISSAAKSLAAAADRRRAAISAAESELRAAALDTAELSAARTQVAFAKADTRRVNMARANVRRSLEQ